MEDKSLTICIVPYTVKPEEQVIDKVYLVTVDAETVALLEDQVMPKEASTIFAATRIFLNSGCNKEKYPDLVFNENSQDWDWNESYMKFLTLMTDAPITYYEDKLVFFLKIEDITILKEGYFEEIGPENFQMLYAELFKELSDSLDPHVTAEWPQFAIFNCEPSRKWIGHYEALYKGLYQDPHEVWKSYRFTEKQIPTEKEVENLKGILITGSKLAAYDMKEWYEDLMDIIRRVATKQPKTRLVGICFGHQITAQALGGKVGRMDIVGQPGLMNRESLRYFGAVNEVINFQFEKFVRDNNFYGVQIHGDNVTELPPEARLIASSTPTPVEMYEYKNNIVCMQFHPEFNAYFMERKLFVTVKRSKKVRARFPNIDEIVDANLKQIQETRDDNPSINATLRLFLKV